MSLKVKTAKNLGYISLMNIFISVIRTISAIILMKILTPYDYGVIAIGMVLINTFRCIENLGLNAAIIQKDDKDINDIVLGTGFVIMLVMAFFLFAISFIIAPYWAKIYDELNVMWLMRFISLIFIISSFGFIPDTQLRKKLNFKKYLIPNIGRSLIYAGSAIAFALAGFKYWSIIIGVFFGEVVRILLLNKLSPWKIKFVFDKSVAKDLFSFGIWIVISRLVYSTCSVIDNALIGKVLGATMLGYYAVAYRWGHFTSNSIKPIFQTVMFPVYSKIRNDLTTLHKGYLDSIKYISLVAFPITLGWIFLADKFILNVIGNEWENAIIPLQILSVSGLMRSLQLGGELFPALGKPRIATSITVAQLVILCSLIYPLILNWGLIGASVAVVITFSIITCYVFFKISQLIHLPVTKTFKQFMAPMISSLGMGIILYFLKNFGKGMLPNASLLEFLFLFIVGIIFYFIFLFILTKGGIITELKEILNILKPVKTTTKVTPDGTI